MTETRKEKFLRICAALIEEAKAVGATHDLGNLENYRSLAVDQTAFYEWWGKVRSLSHQLGAAAQPWAHHLEAEQESASIKVVRETRGTLQAIHHEIENDHLESFTQLVRAETMADLLDQAEQLLAKSYFLAAGVIGRAVLEEHLRNTCSAVGCLPNRAKPTINDFNMAMYGEDHYSKIKMKQIDALAAIGNDAAHNKPELKADDVRRLISELPELIESTGV